ncbi:LysR family transcriptional regulator [Affinibrenneria salicis]|uniref:LysR family transcriptional regulator n=1 Tax=Affinibrenneria salicis TaxID=2590031 RepID=A0A5J5G1K8_9GAMM|nr:LysR substrate-binding domain-containing protein [Affinibrenneria salicis]KAA9000604.1 LysR family transcriptional regulator [Affinibrenneria salicis]
MTQPLPPLNLLATFETVGNCLSITAAARALFITHGAVSKQIKTLESQLGFAVIERNGRGIRLTLKGQELHRCCQNAFAQLADTLARLSVDESARPLTVSCEPTLCMRFLIPRLPAFKQAHPDIDIHLLAAGGDIDLQRSHTDLALRRDDFIPQRHYCSLRIASEYIAPVYAPHKRDERLPLARLHTASRPQAWQQWQARHAGLADAPGQQRHFEHFWLSLQAAESGLGAAIASLFMVERELHDGRLQTLAPFQPDGSQYVLLSARPCEQDPRSLAFSQWLRDEMRAITQTFIAPSA